MGYFLFGEVCAHGARRCAIWFLISFIFGCVCIFTSIDFAIIYVYIDIEMKTLRLVGL